MFTATTLLLACLAMGAVAPPSPAPTLPFAVLYHEHLLCSLRTAPRHWTRKAAASGRCQGGLLSGGIGPTSYAQVDRLDKTMPRTSDALSENRAVPAILPPGEAFPPYSWRIALGYVWEAYTDAECYPSGAERVSWPRLTRVEFPVDLEAGARPGVGTAALPAQPPAPRARRRRYRNTPR